MRETAHIFGLVTLEERSRFLHQFAPVFNAGMILDLLNEVMHRRRRKTFLIIDNGSATTSTRRASVGSLHIVIASSCSAYHPTRPS